MCRGSHTCQVLHDYAMLMLIMSLVLMDLVHCDDVSSDNGDDDSDNEDNDGKGIDDRPVYWWLSAGRRPLTLQIGH